MSESETRGLLLPLTTLLLLGAGSQGSAAIRNFGFKVGDFDSEYAELVSVLERSDDPEAPAQLLASGLIVEFSRTTTGWISVQSDNPEIPPVLLLFGSEGSLAVGIHGPVVEYVFGDADLLERIIAPLASLDGPTELSITRFDMTEACAAVRIRDGVADIAAVRAEDLHSLSAAAEGGLASIARALSSFPAA